MKRCHRRLLALLCVATMSLIWSASASAALPVSCTGSDQVTDVAGDGHHDGADVLRAWFAEDASGLHVVMTMFTNLWVAQHDEASGAGYAMVFTVNGVPSYVRARAPLPAGSTVVYDYGTYTAHANPELAFTSRGATTGSATPGLGGGVVIDVPAAIGLADGSVAGAPFVVTYDGEHFVDHGPGGVDHADSARGADYTVGGCAATGTTTTSVAVKVRRSIIGAQSIPVVVQVLPARAGVAVQLTRRWYRSSKTVRGTTNAAGQLAVKVPIGEVTRLSATADGVSSQTTTVDVRAKFALARITRTGTTSAQVRVRVSPGLPGTILVLPADDVRAVARIKVARANVVANLRTLAAGRYQLVYVPAGARAERVTSKVLRIGA